MKLFRRKSPAETRARRCRGERGCRKTPIGIRIRVRNGTSFGLNDLEALMNVAFEAKEWRPLMR